MSEIYNYSSYDDYITAQKSTTIRKWGKLHYIRDITVNAIADRFKDDIEQMLCHGTRTGEELVKFSAKMPNVFVWGSELSDLAKDTPNTTVWDFNVVNPDWVDRFDLVYTNSFDHCITPVETLGVWKDQLRADGRLVIEWTDMQNSKSEYSDPVSATMKEVIAWAEKAGFRLTEKLIEKQAKHAGTLLVFEKA